MSFSVRRGAKKLPATIAMPPSTMPPLPIDAVLPELGRHLAAGPSCVLEAEPGAGKTTRVPLALLEAEWLAGQKIVLLEPRRLAARAAAHFMAAALGEEPGLTVGYRMRQATCVSEKTRLEVVTEGVLSRLLQDDPELSGVGCVVFDEFHERSLQADTGLAFCLEVQRELRPDLRILVMSATMDCQAVARLLGGAPVVSCPGRNFPVQVRHGDLRPRESREEAVARAVRQALGEEEGSLLVFLPGAAEIRRTAELLERSGLAPSIDITPLLGSLSLAEQERAIRPAPVGRRKVVLATSIAETSLTIEGIRVVIDSGLSRVPRFDPASGMTRLVTVPVSRATASQRKGRAGRLAPGVCYRLWEAMSHGTLQPFNQPEIMAADLAALVLELANWGTAEPRELAFLDQPPAAAWQQARELLTLLGGLDKAGRITSHGKLMAALPTHPRLAHMLLRGRDLGLGALACELAALLEERDVLHEQAGYRDVDLRLRVELLHEKSDRARQAEAARHGLRLDTGLLRRVREGAERFRQRLGLRQEKTGSAPCGLLLALAYPDRLGRRRPGSNHRYKLSNGRGAFLPEGSPLGHETEFLVAANLDGERSEARVFLAAPMEKADLPRAFGSRLQSEAKIAWNPASRAVEAVREVRLAGLVVGEEPLARPDPDLVTAALVAGIRELGANCLPWNRELRQW